jgi:flagellar motor protein MotB
MQQKKNWFLRKKDGSEYGPVSLDDLLRWSAQCRIVAGNAVSTDREEWIPVEEIPELEMHWIAHRADGKEYGPFALAAVQELFAHNVLPADAVLVNRLTSENKPLSEVIALPSSEKEQQEADAQEGDAQEGEQIEEGEGIPENAEGEEGGGEEGTAPEEAKENDEGELPEETGQIIDARETAHDTGPSETELQNRLKRETEALQTELAQLRQELLDARTEASESTEAYHARVDVLKAKLLASQNEAQATAARLEALENKRAESQQQADDDLADLRKQTAFMKKNIAALHVELDEVRRQSVFRAKIVLALGSLLTIIAAVLIIRAAGGCSKRQDVGSSTGQTAGLPPDAAGQSRETGEVAAAATVLTAWPSLQIDGLNVDRKQDHLVIRFKEGAFGSLTNLTPAAEGQLKLIVEKLRPELQAYRLVVEGHTDDTAMRATATFADNAALAAARAETGAAYLKREGVNAISATRAGTPPYPNDTADNRRRNRTLVIKVYRQ